MKFQLIRKSIWLQEKDNNVKKERTDQKRGKKKKKQKAKKEKEGY